MLGLKFLIVYFLLIVIFKHILTFNVSVLVWIILEHILLLTDHYNKGHWALVVWTAHAAHYNVFKERKSSNLRIILYNDLYLKQAPPQVTDTILLSEMLWIKGSGVRVHRDISKLSFHFALILIQLNNIYIYIYRFFFSCLHTFSKLCLFFLNFTHKSKNYTHKMQNASHLLQNEALHSKYHKHISKANICKHLCHNINSC